MTAAAETDSALRSKESRSGISLTQKTVEAEQKVWTHSFKVTTIHMLLPAKVDEFWFQTSEFHTLQEIQQLRAAEATTHLVIITKFSRSKTYICSRPTVPCQTSRTYGTKEGYWMIQRRSTIWTRHPLQRLHWQKQELLRTQQFGSWRKRTRSPTKSADRSLAG